MTNKKNGNPPPPPKPPIPPDIRMINEDRNKPKKS